MKITELETFVVGNPPPHFGGRYFIFLKLVDRRRHRGARRGLRGDVRPARRRADDRGRLRAHVIGADPFHIERLWRDVYGRGYSRRPDISLLGVLSGIEMACWDIVGKASTSPSTSCSADASTSACAATRTSIREPGDATDVYLDPDARRRAGRRVRRRGASRRSSSIRPGTTRRSTRGSRGSRSSTAASGTSATVREAVGDRCDLLFGTHGQFTPSGAIRLARRLEPYDPLWFEEPTPPELPEEMARVARATSIPIATGERLTTKYEFARVLETGAASILQLNLGRVGGLLEAKKIAALAEAHYAQIAPHLYCGPVVGAANIQLSACSPNFLILEGIHDWGGFHAEILKTPIRWEDGYVIPPTAPGLGVELDEEVAARHPYEGDELHLTPVVRRR